MLEESPIFASGKFNDTVFHFDDGNIRSAVCAHQVRFVFSSVEQRDLNAFRSVDDVIIGHDIAISAIDDHAGAHAAEGHHVHIIIMHELDGVNVHHRRAYLLYCIDQLLFIRRDHSAHPVRLLLVEIYRLGYFSSKSLAKNDKDDTILKK